MQLKNTQQSYGFISRLFHWVTAPVIIGLFILGLWMEDLDYYDPWYQTAPHWHKSVGVLLVIAIVARLGWRFFNPQPNSLPSHKKWEKWSAKTTHIIFYVLILAMFPTGYLVTTAKGKALEVFDWFSVPSVITGVEGLEVIAIDVHEILGKLIIVLALVHAGAALKHHFFDRDNTLKRMLTGKSYLP